MKILLKFDVALIAIVVILSIFLFRECSDNGSIVIPEPIVTIDTIEVVKDTTIYKPGKTIYKKETQYVNIPSVVDTAQILKEYFAKNIYIDTLILKDELGSITLTDTISENKIKGRVWNAIVKERIVTKTITLTEPPRTQLYYGLNGGFDKINFINSVSVGVVLKTKLDKLYNVNIGVINVNGETEPYISGGIYWKIRLKKR